MDLYLLDLAAPSLVEEMPIILFTLVCFIIEAFVLFLFKVRGFAGSLAHAAIVNSLSLVLGLLLFPFFESIGLSPKNAVSFFLVMWMLTVVIEGALLLLLNRKQPAKRILFAAAGMNVLTYVVLYLAVPA